MKLLHEYILMGFSGGARGKRPTASAGDTRDLGLIPGLGRSSGGGHGNALQYSCLENRMNRGAWQVIVHRVAKSQTRLNTYTHTILHTRTRFYSYTPVFLPGESQRQRGLLGHSPWGCKELDMTEVT